jgi:hypothetical protein
MRAIRRKIRTESHLRPEAGFPRMGQVHYLPYLEQMHLTLAPKVYLEIGTESGASLSYATCIAFAVDPAFNLQADVSRNKPELHQFQGTSDAFFATGMVEKLGYRVDLAFLDGLHLFEFLLRDFINTEQLMAPGGVITMHNCVPINHLSAEREWDREKTGGWTGDVWKLVPILREYRPDLEVRVLDLLPTGLVSICQLNPQNRVLQDRYDEIVSRYGHMTIDDFGLDRFAAVVAIEASGLDATPRKQARRKPPAEVTVVKAVSMPAPEIQPQSIGWFGPIGAMDGLSVAMKTSVREPKDNAHYGDYYFAQSIGQRLVAKGQRYRIDSYVEWNADGGTADIDLVLHGTRVWEQRPTVPSVQWVLYPGSRKKRDILAELRLASHVLVSSQIAADGFRAALPGVPVSVLLQGFDADLMYPGGAARTEDMVFVGSNHKGMRGGRPIIDLAVKAGLPVRMWGRGWQDHAAAPNLVAEFMPNAELGNLYRSARIVLCDHMPSMRENGYISNRIFDALACGAAVISDPVAGLPEEFAPFVRLCATPRELELAVADILAEGPEKAEERQRFARSMCDRHSLQQRADAILDICRSVAQTRANIIA